MMPVPSSPASVVVTMIETTDGSSVAAIWATDPAGRLTTAWGATTGCVGVVTAACVGFYFVAATTPPATRAPTRAATAATTNNDSHPERRPSRVTRGSLGGAL